MSRILRSPRRCARLGALVALTWLTVGPAAAAVPGTPSERPAVVDVIGGLTAARVVAWPPSRTDWTPLPALVDAERRTHGAAALAPSACLQRAAERHAAAMAADGVPRHQELTAVLARCGLAEVGENVAAGYADPATVTLAWLASPAHRVNLLDPVHRVAGTAEATDRHGVVYVCQLLGA